MTGPDRIPRHRVLRRWLTARRVAALVVGLALSVVSAFLVATLVDIESVMALVVRANPVLASIAVLTLGLSIVVRTARWRVLLPSSGAVRLISLVPVVLMGYLANSVVPLRLGDPLRAGVASRKFRIGLPEALGSVIAERLIDTAALALVIVATSVWWGAPSWLLQSTFAIVALCALAGGLLYGVGSGAERFVSPAGRLAKRLPLVTRYGRRLLTGVQAKPKSVVLAVAYSAGAWLIDGVTFWLCAQALGITVAWPVTMLIAGAAALGMAAPSGPAAVGIFELAGTAAGIALGLTPESALALVVFAHALTVVPLVVAGVVSMTTISRPTADRDDVATHGRRAMSAMPTELEP